MGRLRKRRGMSNGERHNSSCTKSLPHNLKCTMSPKSQIRTQINTFLLDAHVTNPVAIITRQMMASTQLNHTECLPTITRSLSSDATHKKATAPCAATDREPTQFNTSGDVRRFNLAEDYHSFQTLRSARKSVLATLLDKYTVDGAWMLVNPRVIVENCKSPRWTVGCGIPVSRQEENPVPKNFRYAPVGTLTAMSIKLGTCIL